MNKIYLFILSICLQNGFSQSYYDSFEGTGNITTWFADGTGINTNFDNPHKTGINTSSKVMQYIDGGGLYANVRFDTPSVFNLTENFVFSFKIYVPSSSLTGSQTNQVSLKLQNGSLTEPWSTQCEIIKQIVTNQWQTVTFNFETDNFINLASWSANPTDRFDFNRVMIQVNGENNSDQVTAYIDDFMYDGVSNTSVYNTLVLDDQFTGTSLNTSSWHYQTELPNSWGWYNNELQHYTNRTANTTVSGGYLNIIAKKETFTDQGLTRSYTSARLNSKVAFTYGKVEMRAKLPSGAGTWPAFWMLGKNIIEDGAYFSSSYGTAAWPACGEVDIMEHWGTEQNKIQSTLHTTSSSGASVNYGSQTVSTASSAYHTYTLEWTAKRMIFSVDGVIHYIYNPATKTTSNWPFNQPQYLLLNLAIQPEISSTFTSATFSIDYVKVYQKSGTLLANPSFSNNDSKAKIVVAPNPTTGLININTDSAISRKEIFNVEGKLIKTIADDAKEINLSDLNNGNYILKISTHQGELFTEKIIKN